jgi:hypothetical protein
MTTKKVTPFSVGRRWRIKLDNENRFRHGYPFDFLIVGPGKNSNGKDDGSHKLCRLELAGHTGSCGDLCVHGKEQTYPTRHLKLRADLVPVEENDWIPVHSETNEGSPRELCCFCWKPTKFWTGRDGGISVACCQDCAKVHKREDLPTKRQWCDDPRQPKPFGYGRVEPKKE